ncbi:tetratricopeptide repeat protein [Sphingomonas sp. MG17]|uniref:Tetratricopeptide repeat protein n=1 Tax=Sphingomonas tagetis TaxID=2949092 RepID=A0A9X2KL21_9SPHN|nr:tetratricopeptide repeat protein [Sphingomonas tagetis]
MRMIRLAIASSLALSLSQPAFAAQRWPFSYEVLMAFQRGDFAAVLAALRADLARCKAAAPDADQCLDLLLGLANVAAMAGELEGGELHARSAVALAERSLPAGHPDIATSWNNLAVNLNIQGRHQEAEPLYRKALALREAALPPGHRDLAASWNGLASNLNAQGRFAEAEPMFRKALALNEAAAKPYPPDIATSWNNLAANIDAQGRYADAEPLYRKALALREAALPAGHPTSRQAGTTWRPM